jgi:Ca-activated chloride channel family protein
MTLGSIFSAFAPSPYRMLDQRPSQEAEETKTPGAELVTTDGRALPLVASTLRAEAGGGIARVVLEQTFANPYEEALHVMYKMPLPADGAVSGYAFEMAGRVVEGRVDPKKVAREKFEQAIASGRTAALLEQQRDDIFTQEVGNIPARTSIVARITVDQRLAWLPEGEWEFRFPTVIGPRYIGTSETEADAREVHVKVADEPLPVRMKLELRVRDALTPGRTIESPSHALARTNDGVVLRAKDGVRLDRDLVVRWAVTKPAVGVSIDVARDGGAYAYALLTVVPPAPEARVAPIPRDLIVLLDTSGSMSGGPLDQAKRVVARILDSLDERDQFEVIEFSNRPNRYHAGPLAGTVARKRDAIRWVMSRKADGGTEMHTAVKEALKALRPGAQRQVVLVTDGYIGGEQQIVKLCHESLPESCRLHVVGVGAAANRALATALARAGRGCEVLVGLDEDAERGARRLLDRTASPILTDVTITGDAIVRIAPEHVPDVFAGSPVVAALELRPEGGDVLVRGKLAHGEWQQRVRVPRTEEATGNGAIVALFGRERVADLETRWSIGRDTMAIDREIEETGVRFQIATRLTSWVAIDKEPSVDPYGSSRVEFVPQELPYGTTAASFGLAAAAGQATPLMFALAQAAPPPAAAPLSMSAMAPAGFGGAPPPAEDADEELGMLAEEAASIRTSVRTKAEDAPAQAEVPSRMSRARAREPEMKPKPVVAPAPAAAAGGPLGAPPPAPHGMTQIPRLETVAPLAAKKRRSPWIFVLLVLLLLLAIAALAWFFFVR